MDFSSERHLCEEFIRTVPDDWVVYPETCGFDILLSHKDTGHQVGIEAKLRLNSKVLVQALPSPGHNSGLGPDFRAILVPRGRKNDIATLAKHMGITVLSLGIENRLACEYMNEKPIFKIWPELPEFVEPNPHNMKDHYWRSYDDWADWCPIQRETLPEVIPDVACGVPSPIMLTEWKIKAIQLIILLDKFGPVSRKDFNDLRLNQSLWTQSGWLFKSGQRGYWKRCDKTPDLRNDHPKNFLDIEAMIDTWMPENRKGVKNG